MLNYIRIWKKDKKMGLAKIALKYELSDNARDSRFAREKS